MMMRCDAEAGCCGSPLLPSEHLHPMSGFHPSATSENNSQEHPETPALSVNKNGKVNTCKTIKKKKKEEFKNNIKLKVHFTSLYYT